MTTSCSGASGPQGRTSRSSSPAAAACVVAAVACVGAWALLGRAGSGPPPALAAPRTAAAGSLAAVPPPACPAAAAATAAARARSRRCRRLCASLGEGAEGPARAASGALAPERAGGAGRGGAPAGAVRGAPPAAPAPLGGLCKRARCIAAQTRNNALPCGWWRNHSASVASRHASRTPANWGEPGGGHGGCAAAMASQQQQLGKARPFNSSSTAGGQELASQIC